MANVEEMMEILKTESFSLHVKLIERRTAYARALMNNIRFQRTRVGWGRKGSSCAAVGCRESQAGK